MMNPSDVPGKRPTRVRTHWPGAGTESPLSGKLVSQDQSGVGTQEGHSPLAKGNSRFRHYAGARGSHIIEVCKKQRQATHGGRVYDEKFMRGRRRVASACLYWSTFSVSVR